jgi:hypothetical protein
MGTCVELEQELTNSATRDGVQITSRLVRKQHRRLRNERSSQCNALLLSARKLPRIMSGAGAQTDAVEGLHSRAACLRASRQLQRQHDVFQRGEGRNEVE